MEFIPGASSPFLFWKILSCHYLSGWDKTDDGGWGVFELGRVLMGSMFSGENTSNCARYGAGVEE